MSHYKIIFSKNLLLPTHIAKLLFSKKL